MHTATPNPDGMESGAYRNRNLTANEVGASANRDRQYLRGWLSFEICICAIVMILVAFKEMFAVWTYKRTFLCAYAILFAILTLIFEFGARCTGKEHVQKQYFGFMFTPTGRMVFCGFMGLLCVGLGLWGMFMAGLWFLSGFGQYAVAKYAHGGFAPYAAIYDYSDSHQVQHEHNMAGNKAADQHAQRKNAYAKHPLSQDANGGYGYNVKQ